MGASANTGDEIIGLFGKWINRYPIVSIEDELAEHDWSDLAKMTAAMGEQIQIVGDDILVTNPRFIVRRIQEKTCNAALIKLNQIGTVSETVNAMHLCRQAGWGFVVSLGSGRTEDIFISDFAVGCLERVAKNNRLREIDA